MNHQVGYEKCNARIDYALGVWQSALDATGRSRRDRLWPVGGIGTRVARSWWSFVARGWHGYVGCAELVFVRGPMEPYVRVLRGTGWHLWPGGAKRKPCPAIKSLEYPHFVNKG